MSLALNIFRSDKPTLRGGPVLPMSKEDAEFWRIWNERRLERAEGAPR